MAALGRWVLAPLGVRLHWLPTNLAAFLWVPSMNRLSWPGLLAAWVGLGPPLLLAWTMRHDRAAAASRAARAASVAEPPAPVPARGAGPGRGGRGSGEAGPTRAEGGRAGGVGGAEENRRSAMSREGRRRQQQRSRRWVHSPDSRGAIRGADLGTYLRDVDRGGRPAPVPSRDDEPSSVSRPDAAEGRRAAEEDEEEDAPADFCCVITHAISAPNHPLTLQACAIPQLGAPAVVCSG